MNWGPDTGLYGVIGFPLGHSLSPAMHNAAFSEKGVNAIYLAFESRDAEGCMRAMRALNIKGMSVTAPHKKGVIPLLDKVDEVGQRTGAVNTILNKEDILSGFNTDGTAVIKALEEKTSLSGKTCLLVGAGGAACAAGYSLKEKGVRLIVTNRTRERGEALASALSSPYVPLLELGGEEADLVVHATPVGTYPYTEISPLSENVFREGMVVMDMVYNPLETRLLQDARARGCVVVSGLSMFVYQGAEQFRIWTGLEPPLGVMTRAVQRALKERLLH